jgi:hypothetical protein
VILVHVDLSVVPDEYLEFARRYPVALNAGVKDIRKSTFSALQVTPEHDYAGAVMVKSDLNYAGVPERLLEPSATGAAHFDDPSEYRVYPSLDQVPGEYFETDELVVERFVPERQDGLFHTRTFDFLGDNYTSLRLTSNHHVANSSTHHVYEQFEPPAELFELRDRLGIDYGKLDYVLHESEVILLDVNKTMGAGDGPDAAVQEMRRHRAAGIHTYLR